MKARKWFIAIFRLPLLVLLMTIMSACSGAAVMAGQQTDQATDGYSLVFDTDNYTSESVTVDDQTITYRAYETIVYVKYPVDTEYQIMNIYIPVRHGED